MHHSTRTKQPRTDAAIESMRRDRALLIDAIGSRYVRGTTARCVKADHEDTNASAGIYTRRDGVEALHCHGCGFDGDVFDVRAESNGTTPGDELKAAREKIIGAKAKKNQKQSNGRGKKGSAKLPNLKPVNTCAACAAITYQQCEALSYRLSVSMESLYAIGIDFDGSRYTFPERDAGGNVIGHATRTIDGAKRCIKGSRRGLTIPDGFDCTSSDPVLIVEGQTDTAACITLGINVIGRPSNLGGVELLAVLLRDFPGEIFVVGERDQKPDGRWPGREGAERTAQQLADRLNRAVAWTLPPDGFKDIRQWLEAHDAHTVEELREVLL